MQLLNIQIDLQWKNFSVLKLGVHSLALTNHLKRYALLQISIRCNTDIVMLSSKKPCLFELSYTLSLLERGHVKSWEVLQR